MMNKVSHSFTFLLLLVGLFSATALTAQPEQKTDREEKFERIRQFRQKHLTEAMELTEEEAAKFFPLFWKYDQEIRNIKAPLKRRLREFRRGNIDMTEAEARQALESYIQKDEEVLKVRRRGMQAFLEVIPATKLLKLEAAEREFRKQLVERVRSGGHRRGEGGGH